MLHSLRSEHSPQGERQDFQVEKKRLCGHVFGVVADFDGNVEFVASIDLRPAGDAGKQVVQATRGAQGDQIVLIEEGRPRRAPIGVR